MLICLFTAFLFFVVRMPANDQRSLISHSPKTESALKAISTIGVTQPVLQYHASNEDREAA